MFSIIRLSRCSFWTARGPGPLWDPNGDGEIRTHDPLLARQVLSQLSYTPVLPLEIIKWEMGLSGLEPPTSRLSGVRSNLLSYKPLYYKSGSRLFFHTVASIVPSAVQGLTVVFGMGTGISPARIATRQIILFHLTHKYMAP